MIKSKSAMDCLNAAENFVSEFVVKYNKRKSDLYTVLFYNFNYYKNLINRDMTLHDASELLSVNLLESVIKEGSYDDNPKSTKYILNKNFDYDCILENSLKIYKELLISNYGLEYFKTIQELNPYDMGIIYLNNLPYQEYLNSKHWKHFRSEFLKFANGRCQLCNNSKNINVHHKTYINKGFETFNDVIALCEECHSKFHDK
jgi:hypothetical protein